MKNDDIRLNRYLAGCGICSRREADKLIAAERVSLLRAGEAKESIAETGMTVGPFDRVFLDGREVRKEEGGMLYYLYHKPAGIVCTTNRKISENILDAAGIAEYASYAGRLDKDSTGLVLLTNDTAVLHGASVAAERHEKEYLCTTDKPVTPAFLKAMESGVFIVLDDERHLRQSGDGSMVGKKVRTRPCKVRKTGENSFSIVLTQGFNRQIRRMCRELGYRAVRIHRVRLMDLKIGDLPEGEKRELTKEEVQTLKRSIKSA